MNPAVKIKHRYVRFRLIADEQFSAAEVRKALTRCLVDHLGLFKLAEGDFAFLEYTPEKGEGIIRCSPQLVEPIRAALVLFDGIGLKRVSAYITKISGTIKKVRRD